MCVTSRPSPETLLNRAREGCSESLGALLQLYRNYLQLLARTQVDMQLQGRASPSDVVQETVLDAVRDFAKFRGTTEAELLAWLRRILVNNVLQVVKKHVLTQKRDVRREVSLNGRMAALEQSASLVDAALAGCASSPSLGVHRRERECPGRRRSGRCPSQ